MTAQAQERLLYQGAEVGMCTQPLGDYFVMGGIRPQFELHCTALWRRYIGRWEIVDDRLYLIDLSGTLEDGTEASVATVFPDFPERVFAHWYTGTIRIPQGEMLKYFHAGYGSTYERDLFLEVVRGVVVSTRVQHNSKSEPDDVPEDYATDEDGPVKIFPLIEEERGFVVGHDQLQERLSVQEIEAREMVHDPLCAVPNLPFGHLNAVWCRYLEGLADGDELWSFTARWQHKWGKQEHREGYVLIQNGNPGDHILTVWEDPEEQRDFDR